METLNKPIVKLKTSAIKSSCQILSKTCSVLSKNMKPRHAKTLPTLTLEWHQHLRLINQTSVRCFHLAKAKGTNATKLFRAAVAQDKLNQVRP